VIGTAMKTMLPNRSIENGKKRMHGTPYTMNVPKGRKY